MGAVWAFALLSASMAAAAPPARYSAEELRAHIAEAQAQITSIRVEIRSNDYDDEDSRRSGTYLYRVIAAKAPASLLHISAHGQQSMDWRMDPEAQHAIIAAGKARNIYEVNRAYIEDDWADDRSLPGTLPTEIFFYATGIYPLTKRPAPRNPMDENLSAVLTGVAASRLYDHVRPAQERLDERWCHVIERPGHDALWIDVERGCAVMAREFSHKETGAPIWRLECSGHKEAAPGVWIPAWIRNIHFDYLAPAPARRNRRLQDTRLEIVRADVNSVSDDEFRFNPPPGALRLNGPDETPQQTVPGGEELLDNLVAWSRSVLKARWDRAPSDQRSGVWPEAVLTVCILALIPGLYATLARRRRRTEAA